MSSFHNRINMPQKIAPQTAQKYLELLTIAIGKISLNRGALRKDIWRYFQDNFECNYQTYLLAITQLIEEGKI